MAIDIIATTVANNSNPSTYLSDEITFDKPSSTSNYWVNPYTSDLDVEDGDMLVMVVGVIGTQGYVERAGWTTAQGPDKGSPDRQVRLLYRVITNAAGEPSTYKFDIKANVYAQGIMMTLRGADIVTPTFARTGQGDDDPVRSNGACPSITTTFDEALILACMVVCDTSGVPSDSWGYVTGTPKPHHMIDIPAQCYDTTSDRMYVKLGAAYAQQSKAGYIAGYSWYIPNVGSFRNGAEMSMTVAVKSDPNYVSDIEIPDPHDGDGYKNIKVFFDQEYYPLNYNPVHAIWQCLLIVGLPESWLDADSFLEAAIDVWTDSIGVSVLFRNHQACLVYLKSLLSHINGVLYYGTDGKLHIKLIRDDYDVGDLPVVTVEELLEEPDFERGAWMETLNEVQIQYNQITVPQVPEEPD